MNRNVNNVLSIGSKAIFTVALIGSLNGCGKNAFTGDAPARQQQSGDGRKADEAQKAATLEKQLLSSSQQEGQTGSLDVNEGVATKPKTIVPVLTICSENLSSAIGVGTNLKRSTDGPVIKLIPSDNSSAAIMLDDVAQGHAIRNDIMSKRQFGVALETVPNGSYTMLLCDRSMASICSTSEGRIGALFSKGVLGLVPRVIVQNGAASLSSPMSVLLSDTANNSGLSADDGEACKTIASPLIIDLSGAGISMSSQHDGVEFDIYGRGQLSQISWPNEANAGFLALDRNGDDIISDVHELFGNNTIGLDGATAANGFAALAKYDFNADGQIDSKDAIYSSLRVWVDANRDGVGRGDELVDLVDSGIESIDLRYLDMNEKDRFGNATLQRSVIKLKSGEFRPVFDVWFNPL